VVIIEVLLVLSKRINNMNLIGYVIIDRNNGLANLLFDNNEITEDCFPIGQCLEYCIDNNILNPKIYTNDEFVKELNLKCQKQ
jgi:hypothetical protein